MKQRVVYTLLLCALVLVVFQQVRTFAFLSWDDAINVTENPLVLGASADGLARIWSEPYAGLYVPVAYTWFWVLAQLSGAGGVDARLFHVANLVLHLVCVWLVFRIVLSLVANERAALVGTLVFAVHPLTAESVAWVTEARGLVSALFALLALYLWLGRAVGERDGLPVRVTLRAVAATLCCAAALLAKPQAAALPLMLALIDGFVVGRPWMRVFPMVALWCVLAAGVFVATKSLQSDESLRFVTPLWARPLVALDACGFYVWKTLAPVGLAADYGRTPQHLLESLSRAWPAALVLALFGALIAVRAWRRWIPFALLFVAALLPVSGLVPFTYQDVSTVADRYAYLALFAVALAVAFALRRSSATVQWTALVLTFAPLATLATRQADTWRNDRVLFTRVLEVNPGSWKAYSNLGLAEARAGRLDAAVENYRRSLAIGPSRWIVHQNLGLVLCQQGKLAEGEIELSKSFSLRRENLDVASNLGTARLSLGRFAEAEEPLRVARALEPRRGDLAEYLGTTLLAQGKSAEAIVELRAAVSMRESADARKNLAQALTAQGDVRGAIVELGKALELRPKWPEASSDLAWLLATAEEDALRDGARAFELIKEVLTGTQSPSILQIDTLAAAQAAVGRYTDAVHTLEELLKAIGDMDPSIRKSLEARRAAYAQQRAWRGVAH